ncbi:MAG: DUF4832 domain-containing protein [Corallococcus sp.]|nr:DUF4832 domain-containing protein [Corallococcus sp.]MCM1359821.1 DUF4832 domain-containing protein [Corallococcus sp.]MCM1395255.1 DUF4832 domain-containing protein [Corallococcus sp.]
MKKLKIVAALFALLVVAFSLTLSPMISFAATDDGYVAQMREYRSDGFESYTITPGGNTEDEMYHGSNLLFVERGYVSVKSDFYTISGPDVLSGGKSLVWDAKPQGTDGWVGTQMGIGVNNLGGIQNGMLVKLEVKVRLVGMNRFGIRAREYNAASGDKLLQNMSIDGNYTSLGASEGLTQDDPETVASSVYNADGDYATVSLTVRGPSNYAVYFDFDAQVLSDAVEHYLIIDDVTVYSEVTPEVEYLPYRTLTSQGFEDGFGMFALNGENSSKNVNVNIDKSALVADGAIKDGASLRLYSTSRTANAVVNSSTISLPKNNYKLFFLVKPTGASLFGVKVMDAATDKEIYSYTYSISEDKRMEPATVTLFDASECKTDSRGVRTCYGEFSVKENSDVYLQIVFKVGNASSNYVDFDDVCLLQAYQYDDAATEMPAKPTKVTGTQNAKYENLGGSEGSAAITLTAVSGISVGIGACALVVGGAATKNKKKYLALVVAVILVLVTVLAACNTDPTETEIPADYQSVAYEKISGKLDNPGVGWVILEEPTYGGHIDIGSSGDLPEASLAALSTTWFHIETREDFYDWTMCDQAVDYWTGTGRRVLLRISTDSCVWPYTFNASPAYLFEKYNVGYEWVPYTDSGPVTQARVTNLSDPVYLERLEKFLDALYEHYKDNPMVDTVEIRGFGMWGEWHHGYTYDTTEERVETLGNVIDKYYDAFDGSGKTLAVSCSWDPDYIQSGAYEAGYTSEEAYQNFVEWSCFDKAWRTEGVTYRRDGGASALRYDYDERLMAEAFRSGKRVPFLGEYANNYANINSAASQYTLESALDDILYKIRPNNTTALGWVAVEMANIVAAGDTDFIDRGNTMMGYRLAVDEALFPKEISAGSKVSVRTTWSNSAVGIFPYDYPMELKLLDASGKTVYTYTDNGFDARTFVQGEVNNVYSTLDIPKNLANGTYTLAVDIPNVNAGDTEHDYIALGMAGEIGTDSRLYKLGNVTVKDGVKASDGGIKAYSWKNVNDIKLDSNSTYQVTFRYKPHFDMANFYFGNSDCYKFSLTSKSGESNVYRWQDISGEVGQKTVTVRTGADGDYKLSIQSVNFDEIGVDQVWIEKKGGYYSDFAGYDPLDPKTLIAPTAMGAADLEKDCIDGDSLVLTGKNSQKNILAKTDMANVPLKKGMLYTVSFDFRAEGDVGNGGYYFLALGNGSTNPQSLTKSMTVIGEWYERADNWDTKKTFSFICTADNQAIFFGVNMPGCYFIDNLIVTASTVNEMSEGKDIGFEHNEIPVYTNIGLGNVETFDYGTFQSSGFNWGQFAFGRMTFDENEVVGVTEGSASYMNKAVGEKSHASLLGRVEVEAYDPSIDNVWFEFTRSKLEYYNFLPNHYYTVEFDYRILKQFGSGYVFCFFRDDTLGDNRFAEAINGPVDGTEYDCRISHDSNGYVRGTYVDYHFKQTFQMTNHNYFQFMICMYGMWEVAVDNVYIYEVNAAGEKI